MVATDFSQFFAWRCRLFHPFVLLLAKRTKRRVVAMSPCRLTYIEGLACYRVNSRATMQHRYNKTFGVFDSERTTMR